MAKKKATGPKKSNPKGTQIDKKETDMGKLVADRLKKKHQKK